VIIAVAAALVLVTLAIAIVLLVRHGGDDAGELRSRLVSVEEVNAALGGQFDEVDPDAPREPPCGLADVPTQRAEARAFHDATTAGRLVSSVERYHTSDDALIAFEQERSLATTCADREYERDGASYTLLIVPLDDVVAQLSKQGRGDYVALLIGSSRIFDSSTTTASAPPDLIYEFVVETVDGPTIVSTTFVSVDREPTSDEIDGSVELFQISLSRS